MTYFIRGVAYVIIPTADITNDMTNSIKRDFYSDGTNLRKSNDGTSTLFKVKKPISAAFDGYRWMNRAECQVKMEESDWKGVNP